MRILCAGIVFNERDVLPYTLDSAIRWADKIHILDNGSTDGTTEVLEEYSRRYPELLSYHRDSAPNTQATRTRAVHRLMDQAEEGDWWGLLDADEIYLDEPRKFLSAVEGDCSIVQAASIQFYFTDRDIEQWETNYNQWSPERSSFYLMNWSEARFVRHQPGVRWVYKWPDDFGLLKTCSRRIRLLHYQYRTPPQMLARIDSRRSTPESFIHEKEVVWTPRGLHSSDIPYGGQKLDADDAWKARVVCAAALKRYYPDYSPEVDDTLLPPLPASPRGRRRLRYLLSKAKRKLALELGCECLSRKR